MYTEIKNNIKYFRSPELNYRFSLLDGYTEVWGKTVEDDPPYSPYGPLIADIEITTICNGIGPSGKICDYCYKSNTHKGHNMSFENFKTVINKINCNNQLQQVAFGLGAKATENPDLWDMCSWLRSNNIIPNGTVADIDEETAEKIAMNFGAVAVSYHSDWEVLANSIKNLSKAKKLPGATLDQINIHFVIMEETYEDCKKLCSLIKTDERFKDLNTVVLLSLKECGRAVTGFNTISEQHLEDLVTLYMKNNRSIGFDSCSANKVAKIFEKRHLLKMQNISENLKPIEKAVHQKIMQSIEPCESMLFSIYVNTDCKVFPCSFNEKNRQGFDLLGNEDFLTKCWNNSDDWRNSLFKSRRSCPVYNV